MLDLILKIYMHGCINKRTKINGEVPQSGHYKGRGSTFRASDGWSI